MNKSEKIGEIAKALCAVQKELKGAKKDSENPFFKSRYADLESVLDSCRELLAKNNIAVIQTLNNGPDGPELETMLAHSSGEWLGGSQPVLAIKKDPQGLGSAITYARRYGLAAIVGIVQVDDDGESAMNRPPETKSERIQNQVAMKAPAAQTKPIVMAPQTSAAGASVRNHPLGAYPFPKVARKYIGKTLGDIPEAELKDYAKYMVEYLTRDGNEIKGQWLELLTNIQEFTTD